MAVPWLVVNRHFFDVNGLLLAAHDQLLYDIPECLDTRQAQWSLAVSHRWV